MAKFNISNGDLCNILWNNTSSSESNLSVIMTEIAKNNPDFNEEQLQQIHTKIKNSFLSLYYKKWAKSHRTKTRFNYLNADWLLQSLEIILYENKDAATTSTPTTSNKKEFVKCSEKTKTRRSDELLKIYEAEQIEHAAARSMKKRQRTSSGRSHGSDYSGLDETDLDVKKALALFIDLKLTVEKYGMLRKHVQQLSNKLANKLFPAYRNLLQEKQRCYPQNITISEKGACVKLQSLLDHTATKIISTESLDKLQQYEGKELILHSKWGMDGSSGQSQYKQTFTDNGTDACLFMISMVPINICSDTHKLWQNPRPSSTRYCRPIKFEFKSETSEETVTEADRITSQIKELEVTVVSIGNLSFNIKHKLQLTMIDGKVCNALTGNKSAATCNICKSTPRTMNNLEAIDFKEYNEDAYKFGLSTLHCWIRFMECILHIGYNLPLKKSRVTKEDKEIKQKRKQEIQHNLKRELQIIVDVVRQGSGTSNDGNTARKFFKFPEITSLATGVDERLIRRFSNILQVMACGREINCDRFEEYTRETAKLYVELYNWYYMPASVHKVLTHGASVIRAAMVPIGQLSEEALEAGNKDFKRIRQFNTRKTSRIENCTDIMHHLLVSSDPEITKLRILRPKKDSVLSPEAAKLLEHQNLDSEDEDSD